MSCIQNGDSLRQSLSRKTTAQLVDILQTKLRLAGKALSPQVDAIVHRDLLATLSVLMNGPNARVLINRKLPPEILVHIFNHVRLEPCKRGTPETSVWDPTVVHLDSLIRLSHVCQHWRKLIIDTPTLWNRIARPKRCWQVVEIASQRACGIPLFLSVSMRYSLPRRIQALWMGDKPIQELRLEDASSESVMHYFRALFTPSLESLSLTGSSHRRRRSSEQSQNHRVEPLCTPRLRYLALDTLSWMPTLHTAALTHLYLADCDWRHLLTGIVSLLSASPKLSDLVLVDNKDMLLCELERLRDARPRPVHMHSLRRLVFKCMSSSCAKLFLTHVVQLASETSVRLSGVRPLRRDLLDELSALPSVSACTKLLITGICTRFRVVAEGPSAGIVIEHFVAENEDWGTALPRLLNMTQLRQAHIVLRDSPALFASTPTALFDFLARAPALEHLHLDACALAGVLDGLDCSRLGSMPPRLACPDVSLHVPVPCYRASSVIRLIHSFMLRQTKLGIQHLITEYCPGCRHGGQQSLAMPPRDVYEILESAGREPGSRGAHSEREWRMLRTNWPACESLSYYGIEDTHQSAFCRFLR